MTKLIFHVYMVEIVDQEEARILLQWHVLYKAYVEEEAKLKVGAAANQQEKQTKRKKLVWKFLLHQVARQCMWLPLYPWTWPHQLT
ncbi:unnamed protein product [Brassica oleracea]